jgi:hypothetical protein
VKGTDGILREPPEKKVGGVHRDVIVYAFCLILSFVFWYLNSLGKDFETGIKYPVTNTHQHSKRTDNCG